MSQRLQLLTFFLTSSQPRAWLVVRDVQEQPQVLEMSRTYSNHWSVSLWLKPGDYRCRYYCGDDQQIVYHGPAQLDGRFGQAMDGLVSVESSMEKTTSDPIHILLVEDNPATRTVLAKLLQKDGYAVHPADGYQTALAAAKQHRLDVAICDINLQDGDGSDLLTELKAVQPMEGIAVTGYTLSGETEHYREAGFRVVLHKPIHYPELKSAISALMASRTIQASSISTV